jgi:hypothetical protein
MNILHTIQYDPPNLFQTLVFAHAGDGVALYEDVAVRQEFDGLRGFAPRSGLISERRKVKREARRVIGRRPEKQEADERKRAEPRPRKETRKLTFTVLHPGPTNLCRLFTNLSLFLTNPPILMTSHATPSSSTFAAWGKETPRARSLIRSLEERMM